MTNHCDTISKSKISKIFAIFEQNNPRPKIELNYTNNFTLLIAVMLSAQSTDKSVNKVTAGLFPQYDTPDKMITLSLGEVKDKIKSIGLSNVKAKNILKISHILIRDHQSVVPNNFVDLVNMPGVGQKTADVVLNSGFGMPTIAVDRHILRISHRIGLSRGKSPKEVSSDLMRRIPKKWHQYAHHWLVLHGRYVCKAIKPLCQHCAISEFCLAYSGKNITAIKPQ